MYTILIGDIYGNDTPLYYPNDKEFIIYVTNLNLQVGLCGEFTFRVPVDNPRYSALEQFKIITVCENSKEIWRGFIKELNESFDKSVEVYCLEDLAWLQTEYLAPVKGTYDRATKLQSIVSGYNALDGVSGTAKTFEAGYVIDSGYGLLEVNYETTMLEGLRGLAGENQYVRVRRVYDNNDVLHRYIDFVTLSQYGITNGQRIEFGSNLLNFVKELNTSWMLNVIYPYGAEIEDSEVYEDCPQRLAGTPLSDSTSIEKYGRIAKNIIFETSNSTTLQTLAENYLAQNKDPRLTLELTAVDLSQAGYDIDRLALGDKVRVIAAPFNIDQYIYITDLGIDIQDPSKNSITLSSTVPQPSSLSDQINAITKDLKNQIPNKISILDGAKKNAIALLDGTDGGYVNLIFNNNEQVEAIWITDSVDPTQATKKWVWNENGLGYMYKEDGTWKTNVAMTMNGAIVADRITTGTMSADRINGGHIRANLITSLDSTTEIGEGGTTLDDLAQKSSAIADVDVEYAKNQSSTTAPTSGWATTSPEWEAGFYIWQRTKTTNGNNQASYSDPVCIQGAKGQDGSSGSDGVGISSVTVTYGKSSSPSTQPSSWSGNIPTVGEGEYLWTKTYTTYTDVSLPATTTYTYAKQGEHGQNGQNGQNGQDGTSVTVSSILYQQGDSATTAPTGTWSSNPIVVAQGKYLWTKTTYSDNTTAYTVAYQAVNGTNGTNGTNGKDGKDGKDGTNGTNGADGRGVASTTITYGTSNSASTQPSVWGDTPPTSPDQGTWLWVKTYITYTDGQNPTTSYTKTYIGTDGDDGTSVSVVSATKVGKTTTVVFSDGTTMTIVDGTDGTNGSNGLNGYVHTAWALTVQGMDGATSTTGFSTSVSSGKKYLGTYTDNTAADSENWQSYSWSLIKGADGTNGQDGDDGVGVSAIVEQYYLSTSSTTQTGGSWSTNQPAWVSGKYIWTRSAVTWTNGTTTYTDPVLAKAINGANESVKNLNDTLTQQEIFNRLTNNQQNQGIYLSGTNLYINASCIKAGDLSADRIRGGTLTIGGSNASNRVTIAVYDNNGDEAGSVENGEWYLNEINIFGKGQTNTWKRVVVADRKYDLSNGNTDITRGFRFFPYRSGMTDDMYLSDFMIEVWLYDSNGDVIDYYPDFVGTSSVRRYSSGTYTTLDTIDVNNCTDEGDGDYYWATDDIDKDYDKDSRDRYYQFRCTLKRRDLYAYGVRKYRIVISYEDYPVQIREDFIFGNHRGTFHGVGDVYDDAYYTMVDSANSEFNATAAANDYINISPTEITKKVENEQGVVNTYTATWTTSDRRAKEDIEELPTSLSKELIDATQAHRFKYRGAEGSHYGMIAQEARELLDSLGETDAKMEHSMGIPERHQIMEDQRTIDYQEYIPHLINYVKDLRSEITDLKEEIKKLKGEEDG